MDSHQDRKGIMDRPMSQPLQSPSVRLSDYSPILNTLQDRPAELLHVQYPFSAYVQLPLLTLLHFHSIYTRNVSAQLAIFKCTNCFCKKSAH
jgi:hypothetical protein